MFKNNLFIKICLSFWLATLFMIGGVVTVDWLTDQGPFRSKWHPLHGSPPAVHAQALAWIYEHEGAAALRGFTARLRNLTGIQARFLDEKGVDLTTGAGGRGATEEAVADSSPGSADAGPAPPGGKRRVALAVSGPSGVTYTVITGMPPGPPPPGFPAPWGMIGIRLLVVLMVSGLICYLLARYLTGPILKLGMAARRLAAGDLSARVSPALGARNDELARLALDFDRMAERIGFLLSSQRTLLRDISHELRSPLARLNVALELCRKGAAPEAGKSLDRIERESGRLDEMIGHILMLNRVESGVSVLERKRVDLAGLIRQIAADADFEAGSLNRGVKVTTLESSVVEGDEEMLRRAIDNVARNAVRYTQEGSSVEISLHGTRCGGGSAVITVRDHGSGVPEASLSQLFRPFYRVGGGRERQTGGTGLGLAITEAAVRLHGGTVCAANALGGGLIVEISLPLGPACTVIEGRGQAFMKSVVSGGRVI
jgi:two-component system, OmpR family, sensor histidine kinase CpxA